MNTYQNISKNNSNKQKNINNNNTHNIITKDTTMDKKLFNDIANKLKDIKGEVKDLRDSYIVEEEQVEHIEEINEASEVPESDLDKTDKKRIEALEKLFNAEFDGFHYGGHGSIVDMTSKKPFHSVSRTQASEWLAISKAIKKLKIRWIEISGNRVSVGIEAIKEYF